MSRRADDKLIKVLLGFVIVLLLSSLVNNLWLIKEEDAPKKVVEEYDVNNWRCNEKFCEGDAYIRKTRNCSIIQKSETAFGYLEDGERVPTVFDFKQGEEVSFSYLHNTRPNSTQPVDPELRYIGTVRFSYYRMNELVTLGLITKHNCRSIVESQIFEFRLPPLTERGVVFE